MSRFDGWPKPAGVLRDSASFIEAFDSLHRARSEMDGKILAWSERVSPQWLQEPQVWFSGAVGREISKPRGLVVMHFFNHQTHHRGQAHAMLTASGEQTGDTDLFLIV